MKKIKKKWYIFTLHIYARIIIGRKKIGNIIKWFWINIIIVLFIMVFRKW